MPGARADGLVVDGQAGLRGGPLLVDRRGERRAGAGDRPGVETPAGRAAGGAGVLPHAASPSASNAQPASAPILFLVTTSPLAGLRVDERRGREGLRAVGAGRSLLTAGAPM